MRVICLTGGLASGKSTATKFLEQQGAQVIDADRLGHRAYDPGTQAYRQVMETFGEEVVGDDIQLLDTGAAVARHTASLITESLNKTHTATCQIFTSGDLTHTKKLFPTLCPSLSATFKHIDI